MAYFATKTGIRLHRQDVPMPLVLAAGTPHRPEAGRVRPGSDWDIVPGKDVDGHIQTALLELDTETQIQRHTKQICTQLLGNQVCACFPGGGTGGRSSCLSSPASDQRPY